MARKKKTVRRKTSGPRKRPARSRTASMTARRRPRRSSKVGAEKGGGNGGGPAGLSLAELQAELTTRVADLKRRRADLEAELAEINAELAEVDDSLAAAVPAGGPGRGRGRRKAAASGPARSGGSGNGRRRGGRAKGAGGKNLAESLYEVLKGKEMKVSELVDAVQAAGYESSSPNFRVMVSAALSKNKGTMFKNVRRGIYTTID